MSKVCHEHQQRIHQILSTCPLLPVITIHDPETAVPLCRALVEGGVRTLEITLRTCHGLQAIREVRQALPQAIVGAGTVTCTQQYRQAELAGAQFVITPGVTEAVLDFAITAPVPLLPGVATPSDLMLGYSRGYRQFKFFPAEVAGGTAALKAFAGPFPDVGFCPTGGIRQSTAGDYLALSNVAAVGGSWLTPAELIAEHNWQGIAELAKASLAGLEPAG
ncbi:2-keto-3-deoxy-phosphogluconate aldolase [Marinobacter persicus]|uniref:2-dehydro-3-deoxy-phosphogluconate aldolase n=1 Tax=Marinobacter persicus TaxID=930118 RepID=A0A1I3TMS3_9GAMM|nr:bifunctional 4-hydroxy-2-oxoglutarate aldolase/2-dehydro-3-deoxy-phosphogluconate aldolase [Marinobacter persicus]GHD46412.1 ketohydroxyglutarate aldolase [Marinobacter persicus]SFJ70837.1 2-keto-3-deoxy-phosphogluconate aldolase [Marinobacter persicus]